MRPRVPCALANHEEGELKAVRYRTGPGEYRIGRLEGDQIVDAGPAGEQGFVPTRAAWAELAAADGPAKDLASVTLAHPVVPRKLICIGLNYRDHAAESELDLPEVPVIFAKWTTSLIGHGETIVIPREETRTDYEGEVAVVIAERVYRATGAAARAAVGAYTCFHDVSGRRAQLETPLRQFTYGKSFDTFGPLGPCLVDADGVDLGALDIETVVSGETLQSSNTKNLIFDVQALVEYVSLATTLEPGDVIATGTPGGVGDARDPKRYLREGDVVDITVSGVGTLSNPVTLER
jgi:acylpyruvate hydrolase